MRALAPSSFGRAPSRPAEHRGDRGSAFLVALLMLALAGIVATGLAELGRLTVRRARIDRDGMRAWFVAESGLAETVAGLAAGHSFTPALHALPAVPATTGPPWSYSVGLTDDADDTPNDALSDVNARVMLRVTAFGPDPVRRRLEAVLGRTPDPQLPAAAVLGGDLRALTPDFLLDGRDFDMATGCTAAGTSPARAGLSLPDGAGLPMLAHPEQISGAGEPPSIARTPAPALNELAAAPGATHRAAGALPTTLGTVAAPRFTAVDGDASATGTVTGAGTLYVAGRLLVSGRLSFTGVVAAAGGVQVVSGGAMQLCGTLWANGASALDAGGSGSVRASAAALRLAATVAPLPATARVVAVREAL